MATLTLSDELEALAPAPEEPGDLKSRLLAYERGLITAALAAAGGNQRRAARQLGILPTTLHEKMKRLGLRADAFLPPGARREATGPGAERLPAAGAPQDGEASL
jgi:DNA-binding NtrC family response regulator